ncbi:MAG: helix-turn-helix domain-containing protein [Acidobacteriia bacterium]|nr:helix-turn-helix domain-containing protein [Terriglobia bacterium]
MYPNLRLELWKRRIRQHEFAKSLQMDETVLSKIVNGIRRPSVQLQRQIAVLLNRDEAWLFEPVEGAARPQNEKADAPQ